MKDFLSFRRMLVPYFVHLLFWGGSLLCIGVGIYDFVHQQPFWASLQVLLLGPVIVRLVCEFLILFFRMNETLTDIKNGLANRRD